MVHHIGLAARFQQAQDETDASQKVAALESLQSEVAALISANEDLEDISTSSLVYLSLDHFLAQAYTELPGSTRLPYLRKACDLWQSFLEKLHRLRLLSEEEVQQWHTLMEVQESIENNQSSNSSPKLPPPVSREMKIARFQLQKEAKEATAKFQSLQQRRQRLGLSPDETIDGHDDDSLSRSMALSMVGKLHKLEALEGWGGVLQELPLCRMRESASSESAAIHLHRPPPNNNNNNKGLQLTQITQDPSTGQLRMQRQEVNSGVFQPGWNQPTMSLEELAEREVQQAMARDAAQKQAEANRSHAPRRYEQLIRDGQEDDADLVDASAPLDRAWDNFKDENPRGSGNKRGDVGDRNF